MATAIAIHEDFYVAGAKLSGKLGRYLGREFGRKMVQDLLSEQREKFFGEAALDFFVRSGAGVRVARVKSYTSVGLALDVK